MIIRNTKLTTSHDSQITANQIAAFFKILVHDFTLPSSQAAVSIWNHHHKQRMRATNDNIHSIQFIALCIVSNNDADHDVSASSVQIVLIHSTGVVVFCQNSLTQSNRSSHSAASVVLHTVSNEITLIIDKIIFHSFFIFKWLFHKLLVICYFVYYSEYKTNDKP